jgi:hypothetical protein
VVQMDKFTNRSQVNVGSASSKHLCHLHLKSCFISTRGYGLVWHHMGVFTTQSMVWHHMGLFTSQSMVWHHMGVFTSQSMVWHHMAVDKSAVPLNWQVSLKM